MTKNVRKPEAWNTKEIGKFEQFLLSGVTCNDMHLKLTRCKYSKWYQIYTCLFNASKTSSKVHNS